MSDLNAGEIPLELRKSVQAMTVAFRDIEILIETSLKLRTEESLLDLVKEIRKQDPVLLTDVIFKAANEVLLNIESKVRELTESSLKEDTLNTMSLEGLSLIKLIELKERVDRLLEDKQEFKIPETRTDTWLKVVNQEDSIRLIVGYINGVGTSISKESAINLAKWILRVLP